VVFWQRFRLFAGQGIGLHKTLPARFLGVQLLLVVVNIEPVGFENLKLVSFELATFFSDYYFNA
jgi:hypothetical protein